MLNLFFFIADEIDLIYLNIINNFTYQEEERKAEEAARKIEEERKRKEQEEYEAMKAAFSVEGEGFDENPEEDKENLLQEFINFIKVSIVYLYHHLYYFKFIDTICVPISSFYSRT